ncbi:MAG TPA: PQQ-dependent sugar dehydrogenase, partial [Caldilineaceae bacterium]|nr:PQQ-dependent sugar dehydrogenase [Caldilineaceae bacterium]
MQPILWYPHPRSSLQLYGRCWYRQRLSSARRFALAVGLACACVALSLMLPVLMSWLGLPGVWGGEAQAAVVPPGFADELVTSVAEPTDLAFTPDGRLLITARNGKLHVWRGSLPLVQALQLTNICNNNERGLLGVAVDPDFAANGYIYLYYTYHNNTTCGSAMLPDPFPVNRVARFTLGANDIVDPASELILIDNIPSPEGTHNAGDLAFGPDGYLYISVGDGGCYYAERRCGSNNPAARERHTLLGKILRIARDGAIPPTNPFTGPDSVRCNQIGIAQPGQVCQETFVWGLRNPFRFTIDPQSSSLRLFINDVGQFTWEEIDQAVAGADYGWNVREGFCVTNSSTDCGAPPAGMTNPIYSYHHDTGCSSITGGAFVPPGRWPASYDGVYLYSDWVCGKLFILRQQGSSYGAEEFVSEGGGFTSLSFNPYNTGDPSLYYLVFTGQLRRLRFTGSANRPPTAQLTASPTSGPAPLTVTFDGSGSSDPDGDALGYHWHYGDNTQETTSTPTRQHTYTQNGVYTATLQVEDAQGLLSAPATVRVDIGNTPPQPEIIAPPAGLRAAVDTVIVAEGRASDAESGELGDTQLAWEVRRHHNEHFHPYVPLTTGRTISFTMPPPEELTLETRGWLELRLTATDPQGLSTTITRTIDPLAVVLAFVTEPAGLPLTIAGEAVAGPHQVQSWAGYGLPVEAPPVTEAGGQRWRFVGWSHGAPASHTLTTPSQDRTFTATYALDDDPNGAPFFTSTPVLEAIVGEVYTYTITTGDPDAGDTRTIRAAVKPGWLTLTPAG